jgi:hypothetical protein
MSDKSHVSMEQKQCPACGKVFDSGAILLDTRLRQLLERTTVTGWAICPDDTKEGFIVLIESADGKAPKQPGRVIHMKHEAFKSFFNVPEWVKHPFVFIESDVCDILEKDAAEAV